MYWQVLYGVLVRNYQIKCPEPFDQEFPPTFGFRVNPEVKKGAPSLKYLVSVFKSCGMESVPSEEHTAVLTGIL